MKPPYRLTLLLISLFLAGFIGYQRSLLDTNPLDLARIGAGTTATPASTEPGSSPSTSIVKHKSGQVKITPRFPAYLWDADGQGLLPAPLPPPPNLEADNLPPVHSVLLPMGVELLSENKPVTSSTPEPFTGELSLVTDGENDGSDGYYVELEPGHQWVQIDLGTTREIWGVWLWHFCKASWIYHDVVVQVSDDIQFHTPTILFNSDMENHLGFGRGTDPCYKESIYGRFIPAAGIRGRYVRLWSNGRMHQQLAQADSLNHYTEVQIYGK